MVICKFCNQEMKTANGCVYVPIKIDGKFFEPIKFGNEESNWGDKRCHDCNCKKGQYHHSGCDVERCPNCKGQLISCGCLDEEEENEDKHSKE